MCAMSREIGGGSLEKEKGCSRGRGSALWTISSVGFVDSVFRGKLGELFREIVAYAEVELNMCSRGFTPFKWRRLSEAVCVDSNEVRSGAFEQTLAFSVAQKSGKAGT